MSQPHAPSSRPRAGWVDPAHLPYPLVVAGAWAGRFILLVVALALLVYGLGKVSFVVIPLAVAALFAVLLYPVSAFLQKRLHFKPALAALTALLALIVIVAASISIAGAQLVTGAQGMQASVTQGVDKVIGWATSGPMHTQLQGAVDQARTKLQENSSSITSGALAAGAGAVDFLAGTLIALLSTFFFLYEGGAIWRFLVSLLPRAAQAPVYQASRRGWVSLGAYARTQVIVAGVDALGIGLGALVLGLPFVIPMILLVFIASFVPVVGAVVSGVVAVLVALVVKGPVIALVMLGIVVLVQQIEAHVLQPFLMGKAVALHPLAVIVAVAIGSYLLGIVGALFSVPVLAVANSAVRYLVGKDPFPDLGDGPMPRDGGPETEDDLPRTADDAGDDAGEDGARGEDRRPGTTGSHVAPTDG